MADIQRAIAFVRGHGDRAENARLRYLLLGEQPPPSALDDLFAGQQSDGGWSPFWAEDYSSLDASCYRLAQAESLGLLHTAASQRGLAFLRDRQALDGSWEEASPIAEVAPPWARPGDLAACLYLTANCGLWVAMHDAEAEVAQRAATYLSGFVGEDGRLPTFLHVHWLAASLWVRLGQTGIARPTLASLQSQVAELSAGALAWLGVSLLMAGLPARHVLLQGVASRLETLQGEDGRWASDDGVWRDVHTTLEAIRVVIQCER